MTVFQTIALLVSLTAGFSYVNHRWIRLPTTIGVMLIALVMSLGLLLLGSLGTGIESFAESLLRQVDFDETLMQGMLSFLLFAGALHINLDDLFEHRAVVSILATAGVLCSTWVVGSGLFWVSGALGLGLPYTFCLLFGALISPTDPIAVLGILKSAGVPESLGVKISGESLFNDGVGVVLFLILSEVAVAHESFSLGHAVGLFAQEAVGGAVFGGFLGWTGYRLLKSVDNYQVEVLLTLGLVMGGYTLATALHLSGPIAVVVAGLLIGNHGRRFAMSKQTREHLDTFWELIDEILNAVLFVLIGLEVLLLEFNVPVLEAGWLAVPLVLAARWLSVAAPIGVLRRWRAFTRGAVTLMTWGGLRGGISVALALSLPPGHERDVLLAITYIIVVFSILVQGLTLPWVVRRVARGAMTND